MDSLIQNISITHLWVVLFIVLLILEIFVPGLVMLSISVGFLLGALFAYIGFSVWIQIMVVSIGSTISLLSIRPLFLKYSKNDSTPKSNVDGMIGKVAKVYEEIDPEKETGRVSYFGDKFPAVSVNNKIIKKNQRVVIKKIEGITLFVEILK